MQRHYFWIKLKTDAYAIYALKILQGVPDVVPFTLEDTFRPVNVANGIDEFEANYVKDLLDKGLVTIADVAQQTGISEQDIQNTYNEMSGLAVADALNDPTDSTAEIINLTVGSNPMLSDTDLAAAQAAAQSPEVSEAEDVAGGGQTEEILDLKADTTANELLTIGSGDGSLGDAADLGTVSQDPTVDQTTTTSTTADTTAAGTTETVSDVNETWTYNEETNSFISSTLGDSVPNLGGTLVDGQEYQVTPVIGADGVVAENVVSNTTTTGGNFVLDDIDIIQSPTIKVNNQGQITDGIDTLSKEDSGTFIANLPNTIIEGILDGSLLGQVGDKGDQGDHWATGATGAIGATGATGATKCV